MAGFFDHLIGAVVGVIGGAIQGGRVGLELMEGEDEETMKAGGLGGAIIGGVAGLIGGAVKGISGLAEDDE